MRQKWQSMHKNLLVFVLSLFRVVMCNFFLFLSFALFSLENHWIRRGWLKGDKSLTTMSYKKTMSMCVLRFLAAHFLFYYSLLLVFIFIPLSYTKKKQLRFYQFMLHRPKWERFSKSILQSISTPSPFIHWHVLFINSIWLTVICFSFMLLGLCGCMFFLCCWWMDCVNI